MEGEHICRAMYWVDPCRTEWRLSTVGPCAVAALVELGERCTRVGPCAGCGLVELDGGRAHVGLCTGWTLVELNGG